MRRAICFVALLVLSACSEPPKFADWTIPVPEGTRIIEYAGVALEQRDGEVVGAVEELVLGGDSSDPRQSFFRAAGVAVDGLGNIYVLDSGNSRVQVFTPDGIYSRSIGAEGQGPGEFERPREFAIVGDHLVVRAASRRLSVWTLDGNLLSDSQLGDQQPLSGFVGIHGGFIAVYGNFVEAATGEFDAPPADLTFAAFSLNGKEKFKYAVIRQQALERVMIDGILHRRWPLPRRSVKHAASSDGDFYVTASEEYQVNAYAPDGVGSWAMRVAWERERVTEQHMEQIVASRGLSETTTGRFKWPDRFSALSGIEVDGHGHIYVFPFYPERDVPRIRGESIPKIDRPVDVYSAAGEHLFSGLIAIQSWDSARGDQVYGAEYDLVTGEQQVVRYRLIEPFERNDR